MNTLIHNVDHKDEKDKNNRYGNSEATLNATTTNEAITNGHKKDQNMSHKFLDNEMINKTNDKRK